MAPIDTVYQKAIDPFAQVLPRKDIEYNIEHNPFDKEEPHFEEAAVHIGERAFFISRRLTGDYEPAREMPILLSIEAKGERDKDAYFFPGEAPCDHRDYTEYNKNRSCRELGEECKIPPSKTCHLVDKVYEDEEAYRLLEDTLRQTSLDSAKFYAAFLKDVVDGRINLAPESRLVSGTQQEIDERGVTTSVSRWIGYDSGYVEKADRHDAWVKAQRCDSAYNDIKKHHQQTSSIGSPPINLVDAIDCFSHRWFHFAAVNYNPNLPLYDTSLVGKEEPSYPTEIRRFTVRDDGLDGTTNSVDVEWERAFGEFKIHSRSSYTEGPLQPFDAVWKKGERRLMDRFAAFVKRAKRPVKQHSYVIKAEIMQLNVNERGSRVSKGDSLVRYYSAQDGGTREIKAPFNAMICGAHHFNSSDNEFYLSLAEDHKGCW